MSFIFTYDLDWPFNIKIRPYLTYYLAKQCQFLTQSILGKAFKWNKNVLSGLYVRHTPVPYVGNHFEKYVWDHNFVNHLGWFIFYFFYYILFIFYHLAWWFCMVSRPIYFWSRHSMVPFIWPMTLIFQGYSPCKVMVGAVCSHFLE